MCYVSNYARPLLRVDTNWAKSTKIVKNDGPYTDRHTQFLYCLVCKKIVFTPKFKLLLNTTLPCRRNKKCSYKRYREYG